MLWLCIFFFKVAFSETLKYLKLCGIWDLFQNSLNGKKKQNSLNGSENED